MINHQRGKDTVYKDTHVGSKVFLADQVVVQERQALAPSQRQAFRYNWDHTPALAA
jgi:hypothetical protein